MTDNKKNPHTLLLKEEPYEMSKEEIPCINCGETGLETVRDTNGNDTLRCSECNHYTYWVTVELEENQQIKLNIEGLDKAKISRKCRKCREHLEYDGRNCWERFEDRNQWSCPKGCTRKKEFDNFDEENLIEGRAQVSIYKIISSKTVRAV